MKDNEGYFETKLKAVYICSKMILIPKLQITMKYLDGTLRGSQFVAGMQAYARHIGLIEI